MRTTLTTDCWVLHLNGGYTLAISIYQVAELINNTPRLSIPQAPAHCCYLISWRNKLIPLVDYQTNSSSPDSDNIMIVKFSGDDESILHLAFAVTSVEKHSVNDSDFSNLFSTPQHQSKLPFWSSVISAFQSNGRASECGSKSESKKTTYIIDMKHLYAS